MRKKNLMLVIAGFVFLSLGLYVISQSQPFEMIEIGTGADPHWSPDGTKLAYVYKGALYITNADGTGEPQKIADLPPWTRGFNWMDSTEFVFWGKEYKRIGGKGEQYTEFRIKTLTLKGKEKFIAEAVDGPEEVRTATRLSAPIVLPDRTVGYYEFPYEDVFLEKNERKVFKIIKQGKLPPDSAMKQWRVDFVIRGDIHLKRIDGSQEKKILNPKRYDFFQLSPDGSKILAGNIHYPFYGSWILDLDGKELAYLGGGIEDSVELKPGVVGRMVCSTPRWSPDGKKILVMFSAEDEKTVVATDLFLVNADGNGRIRLTNTAEIIEAYPTWSPDGSRIAYTDYKTSKIFVMKVK